MLVTDSSYRSFLRFVLMNCCVAGCLQPASDHFYPTNNIVGGGVRDYQLHQQRIARRCQAPDCFTER
jgi:hypothetical protein